MKLYRMQDGSYTFRAVPPTDAWNRPVWTEATITFSDNGTNIQLWPEDKPEDAMTLSIYESRIFRLQPTASQLLLAHWFTLRQPDRVLDKAPLDYLDFTGEGKIGYCEWGGRAAPESFYDFRSAGEDTEDLREHLIDVIVRAALRTDGSLP